METLDHGNSDVLRLLSLIELRDEPYKTSTFLIRHKTKDGTILANTLSGEVVSLSAEELKAIEDLPSKPTDCLCELIRHGFLVSQTCDEIQRVEQMRDICTARREANGIITHYDILTTTDCNARCFYCYQSSFRHISMSEETADKVVDFISKHHGDKKIRIMWYGGEPTLGKHRIDYICQELTRKGILFESEMVSNAFLFDQEMVEHAKNQWFLNTIQITLDGTEDIYIKTKAYVNLKENAYKRVIRNIEYFLDANIQVNVRLNLDKHNADNLDSLIDELTSMFYGKKNLVIYIRKLTEDVGYSPIEHSEVDRVQLNQKYSALQNKLEQNGWAQISRFTLPKLRAFSCMADDPYSIQCTPDGILSKCEDKIFEKTIGTLEKGITDKETVKWWRQRIIHEECMHCELYPSCTHLLKHCPVKPIKCPTAEKQYRIELCHQTIARIYDKWKNGITCKMDESDPFQEETGGLIL